MLRTKFPRTRCIETTTTTTTTRGREHSRQTRRNNTRNGLSKPWFPSRTAKERETEREREWSYFTGPIPETRQKCHSLHVDPARVHGTALATTTSANRGRRRSKRFGPSRSIVPCNAFARDRTDQWLTNRIPLDFRGNDECFPALDTNLDSKRSVLCC